MSRFIVGDTVYQAARVGNRWGVVSLVVAEVSIPPTPPTCDFFRAKPTNRFLAVGHIEWLDMNEWSAIRYDAQCKADMRNRAEDMQHKESAKAAAEDTGAKKMAETRCPSLVMRCYAIACGKPDTVIVTLVGQGIEENSVSLTVPQKPSPGDVVFTVGDDYEVVVRKVEGQPA